MAHRRILTAAFAACLASAGANACERIALLEYEISGGAYRFELNGAYLDHGGGQFVSGGAPLADWLMPGVNVLTVRFDGDQGRFGVSDFCGETGARRVLDDVKLSGRADHDLTFTPANPETRLFSTAAPTDDVGLAEAVASLRRAFAARDADAFWELHAAMREDYALRGRRTGATEYKMRRAVGGARTKSAGAITLRPVLGGRVWEARGPGPAPPVDVVVIVDGVEIPLKTGVYWMRLNGRWSVLAPD